MMPVVILCGGQSTRLQPLTKNIPKSMVDVLGKPFIDHQLSLLKENNVKDVVLCIGKFGDQIRNYVEDGQKWDMSVKYSDDGGKLLGTGGALRKANSLLPDTFILMNGDSYLDIDYKRVLRTFYREENPILMTVYKATDVDLNRNVCVKYKRIVAYDKTGEYKGLNYIDYGFTPMQKWLLRDFPLNDVFDFSKIYLQMIQEKSISCYRSLKRFHEIGSYEGLEETTDYIKYRGRLC
jgi:N-acetyl-alpha-D-muramate 1-phosphate uridylyltransferase